MPFQTTLSLNHHTLC